MPGVPVTVEALLSWPRLGDLVALPDGNLVATVTTAHRTRFHSSLWWLPADPRGAPRRLTFGERGESNPAVTPDGAVLFLARRGTDDDGPAQLWRLPADRGEAVPLAAPAGGVDAVAVAESSGTVVVALAVRPGLDLDADVAWERERGERGVTARLFRQAPMRYWDHDLGPRQRQLAVVTDDGLRLLTDGGERHLDQVEFDVSPDGAFVVSGWNREFGNPQRARRGLVLIEVATGAIRDLVDDDGWWTDPVLSPDGSTVAAVRSRGGPDEPASEELVLVDVASGELRRPAALEDWPHSPVWEADGAAVVVTVDRRGHTLPVRIDVADGTITALADDGAFTSVTRPPGGAALFALRSEVGAPPRPVRLRDPVTALAVPQDGDLVAETVLERVRGHAEDGTPVEGWLVLPPRDPPEGGHPLVVFAHGGPYSSWSGWHWRWSPHVLADHGYAVLLPDPAPSTGYGQDFVARGWGRWGPVTMPDLLACLDAAQAREDIDDGRTGLAGGSYGGYVANWAAGHSDRFDAIVTHASLWSLSSFAGTTDLFSVWEREFGDPRADADRYRAASPDEALDAITTPMLVIHGERDFRVPYSQGQHLFTDLARRGVDALFLSFPDEHHWITKPQHVRVWYDTVLAFLDHYVRGADLDLPDVL